MIERLDRHDRRHDDEHGAIAVLSALIMVSVLTIAALVVDVGISRASARDMQAVADSVALDTARKLPSCDSALLSAAANTSLTGQGATIGRDAPLTVTPGHMDTITRKFNPGSNGTVCDAVRITSTATVDYAFAPVIGTSSGTTTRSAVGTSDLPAMCFSAGTRALVLNTSSPALGPVLDQILTSNLGVAGYTGLVDLKDLSVPLAGLNAALIAGTGHALVDNTEVSLGSLLIAQATVLENGGKTAQAVVLRSIAAQVSSLSVNVSKFLALGTAGASGLNASVNALDLAGTAILAAATIADGKNAVNISKLGVSVIGISLADAKASIIEPPVIACGRTGARATTAQVRLDLKTGLSGGAELSLGLQVAKGAATLGNMTCAATGPTAAINAQTSTAALVGYGGTGNASLKVLGVGLLGLQGSVGSGAGVHTFTYPSSSGLPTPPTHTFGSPVNLNLAIAPESLLGLGALLGPLVNPVLALANTTVGSLLTQTLSLFGIRLGTMDVTVLGRPSCNGVRLAQ